MKKTVLVLVAVMALGITTVATGADKYIITSSAQIKNGVITLADLSSGTKAALKGQDGQDGQNGAQGATGPQGPAGAAGPQGATGPKGDKGDPGKDGVAGPAGPAGPQGATGATGAAGANGAAGPAGATGPAGPAGADGATGAQGPAGPTGPQGAQGPPGVTNLEADGPYPGRPDSQNNLSGDQGDQSTAMWHDDGTLQSSWVMCAPGKTALGGGFGQNDDQTDKLVIVGSSPVQIANGKTYLEDGSVYQPIPGDPAGSFVPNGWLVQGYNHSGRDLIVRPWVVCATVH